jgi:uncharacterized membrane protein YqiK
METNVVITAVLVLLAAAILLKMAFWLFGLQIVGNTEVGVVEKKWGGGSLRGKLIALNGEAGFQPDVLRGGFHFLPGWKYKVHKVPLVTIHRGQIGYVFARDGQPLGRYTRADGKEIIEAGQTLGHVVCNGAFTDVRAFLSEGGQQGPQRAILREGTYAINLAQFTVISGPDEIAFLPIGDREEKQQFLAVAQHIAKSDGFSPVIIDGSKDQLGVVTIHDGPSLPQGEIIAPTVGDSRSDPNYHNNFQDPQAFLNAGGYRGRQYQVLSEGTYWINQLFATVELTNKTTVEVGYTGVVVSYYGQPGEDTSGSAFTHGEICRKGGRGIWEEPYMPGKYAFNPYAGQVVKVPTTNIILKWKESEVGEHKLDASLREIGLITKDAFEPELPLSVVISIDYKKAPHVIQRFGSIKSLIEQSLDPLVSAYFKDEGQKRSLIELIQERGEIQKAATEDMRTRFAGYDLTVHEVLIGTPHSRAGDKQIESILDQIRARQVAREQVATYTEQEKAQTGLRTLNEAQALAARQSDLTASSVQIQIETNQGSAAAQRALKEKERTITVAEANAQQTVVAAEAEARRTRLMAEAEAARNLTLSKAQAEGTMLNKKAEAAGIEAVREAYGSSEYNIQQLAIKELANALTGIKHPLVPATNIVLGAAGENNDNGGNAVNLLTTLMSLVLAKGLPGAPPATLQSPEPAAVKTAGTSSEPVTENRPA